MISQRLKLEADLRDILAPELAAVGAPTIYTVWQSAIGRRIDGVLGFTGAGLSHTYRPEIDVAGNWRGIAPGILIADSTIEAHYGVDLAHRVIVSVAAHEVGHVVSEGCQFAETNPAHHGVIKTVMESGGLDGPEEFPGHHDLNFIRATLHVGYRLESMGHDLEVEHLWREGELFKPSAFLPYVQDEFERLRGLTLSQVLETDPPGQFAELYRICGLMAAERNN